MSNKIIITISLIIFLLSASIIYLNRPYGEWYVNDKYVYGVKNNHDLPFINDAAKNDKNLMSELDNQESFTSMNLTYLQWEYLNKNGLIGGKV